VTRKAYASAFTSNLVAKVRANNELPDSSRSHLAARGRERSSGANICFWICHRRDGPGSELLARRESAGSSNRAAPISRLGICVGVVLLKVTFADFETMIGQFSLRQAPHSQPVLFRGQSRRRGANQLLGLWGQMSTGLDRAGD
jgi:hypothetical protein